MSMLLISINLPNYVYRKLRILMKSNEYKDVIKDMVKSRKTGSIIILIENSPKGWWLALKILREGSGKLYMIKEVTYMDIPSKVMELSMDAEWKSGYDKIIKEELRRWGLMQGWGLAHE
ncbi:MAG: hypothetical protein LM583_11360 [Desulfurococcaceae archaeon]|nr:hypothetical protein [Desulfurococcaceae archaeon]